MSRPYLSISPTFATASDVVTLNIQALRMRGINSLVLTGLSASQTINLSNGYFNGSTTFSANLDSSTASGDANTTYVPATATLTFGGSASNTTSVNFQIRGVNLLGAGGYTFSSTQSTVASAINLLVGGMSFTGNAVGFSATTSGNSIVFSSPVNTGNFFNGFTASVSKQVGLGTFTFSQSAAFASGTTTYYLDFNTSPFGDFGSSFALTV
jgi:hypothetical protein